ncbi:MAG: single-stranded-DNA-specific exonuclease RecJ [Chloroflexi bacterium RBG_16_54_18]|nr:MAG: single-stranded-DNA-specific exonuclease RecJ [Chloroflexi bacterium RBG_16_54_18]
MAEWLEPLQEDVPSGLPELVGGHPLVVQALMRRGIEDVTSARGYLDPDLYRAADPLEIPGLEGAASQVMRVIQDGKTILVWGDFDVDGQTATTLLVTALRSLQARVVYHIPVRQAESHGVSESVLKQFLDRDPTIEMVLTCDTGISAHPAARLARGRGVQMVITDHHALPAAMPPADAIVNPRFLPAGHPLSMLPGVGVAYMLARQLHCLAGDVQASESCLDLAALGIVADLAEIRGDNRFLLQSGLRQLRNPLRLGLKVMMELAGIEPATLSEEQIGFMLAPRLNAVGRLGDANPVVDLLTSDDEGQIRLIAEQIEAFNARRQLLTSQVMRAALKQVEESSSLLDDPVLILFHAAWPAGVIGIVASRLVERFGKPVVLVSTPPGEAARASVRSVPGVDITAALDACSDLLVSYGGHAMAAGFSLELENLSRLRRKLNSIVQAGWKYSASPLQLDGYLQLRELNPALVADLERLSPFGPGNPQVVLASKQMHISGYMAVGRHQEHLQVNVEDEWGDNFRLMWWQAADLISGSLLPQGLFDLAYGVRIGNNRGRQDVRIEWVDSRASPGAAVLVTKNPIRLTDYRGHADPLPVLHSLVSQPGVQVWAEGAQREDLRHQLRMPLGNAIRHRGELERGTTLVIWTSPPGQAELRRVLERVQPEEVVLFVRHPPEDTAQGFLKRLAGLAKFALNNLEGEVSLPEMAGAAAARTGAVLLGLQMLEAMGLLSIVKLQAETAVLAAGNAEGEPVGAAVDTGFENILKETSAYRQFFLQSDSSLLGLDSV